MKVSLNTVTDLNNDGVVNSADLEVISGSTNSSQDSSIFTEEYLSQQGYKDVNLDGEINLQDKIYKDVFGNYSFYTMQGDIENTDYQKLSGKIDNLIPNTYDDQQSQEKYNLLKVAMDKLKHIQQNVLGTDPQEINNYSENMKEKLQLGDNETVQVNANKFNNTELHFLFTQGAFKLAPQAPPPVEEPPVNNPPVQQEPDTPPVVTPPPTEPPTTEEPTPPVNEQPTTPPVVEEPPINEDPPINPPAQDEPPLTEESPADEGFDIEVEKVQSRAGYKNTLLAYNKTSGKIVPIWGNATGIKAGTTVSVDINLQSMDDLDLMLLANGWRDDTVQNAVTGYKNESGEFSYEGSDLYFVSDTGEKTLIDVNIYHSSGTNKDGFDHTRENNNMIMFEDLWNGGDNDFDDLVIKVDVS